MKISAISHWLRNYANLNLVTSKWQSLPNTPSLESILQQINASRDIAEIHRLANDYKDIAIALYNKGDDRKLVYERMLKLTGCLQQHPIADEIYNYKLSA